MHFLLGVVVLVTAAVVILRLAEVGLGWLPIVAIVRAIVQLALIALILQGALNAWWSVAAFIALMLTTASLTSLRRARDLPRGPVGAAVGVTVGPLGTRARGPALGRVDRGCERVGASAGILVGNSMAIATLSRRRFAATVRPGVGGVGAWLSVGARPRRWGRRLRQDWIREALLPGL